MVPRTIDDYLWLPGDFRDFGAFGGVWQKNPKSHSRGGGKGFGQADQG